MVCFSQIKIIYEKKSYLVGNDRYVYNGKKRYSHSRLYRLFFVIHFNGSVLNFVSMTFSLIPEAGCGQSPRNLVKTGTSGNIPYWKL